MSDKIDFFIGTTTCNHSGNSFFTVNTKFKEGEYEWQFTYVDDFGIVGVDNKVPEKYAMIDARLVKKQQAAGEL